MKSIVFTYPDFRELPKGLKQMLVVSENLFFEEIQAVPFTTSNHNSGIKEWWRPPQRQYAMDSHAVFNG